MEKLFKNRIVLVPVLVGVAAGAVATIAGGFYTAYMVVTWMGN